MHVYDTKCTYLSGCLYIYNTACSVDQNRVYLLCGEVAAKTSSHFNLLKNLLKYAPKVLHYGGHVVPESNEEEDLMKVIETIDKCLRGSGPGAKAPAVYSLYEVSLTEIDLV